MKYLGLVMVSAERCWCIIRLVGLTDIIQCNFISIMKGNEVELPRAQLRDFVLLFGIRMIVVHTPATSLFLFLPSLPPLSSQTRSSSWLVNGERVRSRRVRSFLGGNEVPKRRPRTPLHAILKLPETDPRFTHQCAIFRNATTGIR